MDPARITGIDHCTLIITDVVKAREFYGKLLGMREVAPPKEFDFVAVWYDLGGRYLHLLLKPEPDTISPRHVCFRVDNIAAARTYCESHGLRMDETVKIAAADRFFLRDPDGNRLEFLQWERPYNPDTDGRYSV
jgi:glyoxylase I family protein